MIHIIFSETMPPGKYDFIANLPQGSEEALQQKIKEQFGVVAHKAVIDTDVWTLKVSDPEKLKTILAKKKAPRHDSQYDDGKVTYVLEDETAAMLTDMLEGLFFQAPVVNRTGLSGRYDLNLHWDNHERSNRISTVVNQLHQVGLDLVLNREKMEMLVVEKVK